MNLLTAALTPEQLRAIALPIASELDPTANKGCGKSYILSADNVIALCTRFLAAVAEQQAPVAKVVRNEAGQIHMVDNVGKSFDMSQFVGASFFLHPAPQPTGSANEPAPQETDEKTSGELVSGECLPVGAAPLGVSADLERHGRRRDEGGLK